MSKIKLDGLFNLDPEEAVAFFADKGLKPTFDWRDMIGQEHDTAFTVAKMMDNDLLDTTKGLLDRALKNGDSFEQFKQALIPSLVEKGWWGRAEMLDPLTGMVSEVQLGSVARLETIYRTNMQSAYSAGKWEQIERNAKTAPYLMYDAVDDNRTREEHARFDGLILRWDHSFWKTHYPPNGWNCRCGVIQLSELEVKEMGLKVETNPPPIKQSKWVNPRTGKTHTILEGTDPGWNHNPGVERVKALKQVYTEKVEAMPPKLKKSAKKADELIVQKVDSIPKAIKVGKQRFKDIVDSTGDATYVEKLEQVVERVFVSGWGKASTADINFIEDFRQRTLDLLDFTVGIKQPVVNVEGSASAKKVIKRASEKLPNSWTMASEADGSTLFASYTTSLTKRASFSSYVSDGVAKQGGKRVKVKKGDGFLITKDTSTTEHEFLHRIQDKLPALDKLFQDLHKQRTIYDPLDPIYPGTREYGRKDGYYNPYQGREYGGQNGALEVMTMALQPILGGDPKNPTFQDAKHFAELYTIDREMFEFALGILFGWRP